MFDLTTSAATPVDPAVPRSALGQQDTTQTFVRLARLEAARGDARWPVARPFARPLAGLRDQLRRLFAARRT